MKLFSAEDINLDRIPTESGFSKVLEEVRRTLTDHSNILGGFIQGSNEQFNPRDEIHARIIYKDDQLPTIIPSLDMLGKLAEKSFVPLIVEPICEYDACRGIHPLSSSSKLAMKRYVDLHPESSIKKHLSYFLDTEKVQAPTKAEYWRQVVAQELWVANLNLDRLVDLKLRYNTLDDQGKVLALGKFYRGYCFAIRQIITFNSKVISHSVDKKKLWDLKDSPHNLPIKMPEIISKSMENIEFIDKSYSSMALHLFTDRDNTPLSTIVRLNETCLKGFEERMNRIILIERVTAHFLNNALD